MHRTRPLALAALLALSLVGCALGAALVLLNLGDLAGADADATPRPCRNGYVALTYDDGPTAATAAVSASLRRHQLHATFFMLGSAAAARPGVVRQVAADGHTIANHTYDHPRLTEIGIDAADHQLRATSDTLASITGRSPRLFRPPYGATNGDVRALAKSRGMTEVIWTLDSNDWRRPNRVRSVLRTMRRAQSGDVILMHDDTRADVAAVDGIAAILRRRGLCTGHLRPSDEPTRAWPELTYNARVTR